MLLCTLANVSACRSIWLEAHSGPAIQADQFAQYVTVHDSLNTWVSFQADAMMSAGRPRH